MVVEGVRVRGGREKKVSLTVLARRRGLYDFDSRTVASSIASKKPGVRLGRFDSDDSPARSDESPEIKAKQSQRSTNIYGNHSWTNHPSGPAGGQWFKPLHVAGKVPPRDSDPMPIDLNPDWLQLPQTPHLAH